MINFIVSSREMAPIPHLQPPLLSSTPFMPTMYVKVFKHQSLLPKVLFVTAVSDDVFIFKLIFKET